MSDPRLNLTASDLTLGYDGRIVVESLNLEIPRGSITALVGANGSGKSTILKALARILKPSAGAVYLDGKAIHSQPTRVVAQQMAILPQGPEAPDGLLVQELVSYGRFPYQNRFGNLSREDRRMIHWALDATGMLTFARRPVGELSGGQRQRAWIAMALAQETDILLLDEPTTFLDMAYQLEVLQLLGALNRTAQRTIVMVVHDLNHASRFAHHIVAIRDGNVIVTGSPHEVMNARMLHDVFNVDAHFVIDPHTHAPMCIPYAVAGDRSSPQPANETGGVQRSR